MLSVGIRVDASVAIGAGHLRRCLTLADSLQLHDARAHFICRWIPEPFAASIRAKGHLVTVLPAASSAPDGGSRYGAWLATSQEEDARQTAAAVQSLDWLVVDHYALDARWETALRACARKILAVDDLADRSHACDILLDQNYYTDLHTRYAALLPPACRQLLGPRYALLREEFANLRQTLRARDGKVERVLVFFGGADADNYTALALEALRRLGRAELAVDVVVGAMNPNRAVIEAACSARPNTRCFVQLEDIATLMCAADLALGAGGSATWERCCLGLPTLAVVTADNQQRLLHDLCERAVLACPSQHDGKQLAAEFAALLAGLLSSAPLLRGMSERSRELVDGRGTQRVISAMLGEDVTVRLAGQGDCERIYQWRNDPQVRAWSRNPAPIDYQVHCAWYAQVLRDPARVLLVAEHDQHAVAVIRFDLRDEQAEVSVYATPDRLGGGWGAAVLSCASAWLQRNRPQVRRIVAEVLPDNLASRGAFQRAGYREYKTVFARSLA